MDNIYCHIVGFNNKDKDKFMKDTKKLNYTIFDLNSITTKVKSNQFYKNMKLDLEKTKSKHEKSAFSKCMFNYWKNKIETTLSKINNNNKIILIGINKLDLDNELNNKLEIKTENKFFLKHNLEVNAKEIIKNNLDKYHDKILEGSFSLDYIDKDYLIQKRKDIMESYKKDDYKPILYDNFIKFLNGEDLYKPKTQEPKLGNMYYASNIKYNKKIGGKHKGGKRDALDQMLDEDKEIIAYSNKWLALISFIPEHQKYFEKGLHENKPFIKIIDKKGKELLKKNCYLYELKSKNFVKASDKNPYKYKAKVADIISDQEVLHISNELQKCNVKII